jgi:hypothetical protein
LGFIFQVRIYDNIQSFITHGLGWKKRKQKRRKKLNKECIETALKLDETKLLKESQML